MNWGLFAAYPLVMLTAVMMLVLTPHVKWYFLNLLTIFFFWFLASNHLSNWDVEKPEESTAKSFSTCCNGNPETLIMISDSLEIDLEKTFDKTMQKINIRDEDRTKKT